MCKVAFGDCGYKPVEFYSLSRKEAVLLFAGYHDKIVREQEAQRRSTLLISEVVNRSMGGTGVSDAIMKAWPLADDMKQEGEELTIEKSREILAEHHRRLQLKKGNVKSEA